MQREAELREGGERGESGKVRNGERLKREIVEELAKGEELHGMLTRVRKPPRESVKIHMLICSLLAGGQASTSPDFSIR